MAQIAAPPLKPSARRRSGVTPAGRDLLVVGLVLIGVDLIAALLLINGYLPSRRREALAKAPAATSNRARRILAPRGRRYRPAINSAARNILRVGPQRPLNTCSIGKPVVIKTF